MGGFEVVFGGIISIVPLPGAGWLGGLLVADGIQRGATALVEMEKKNREDPSRMPAYFRPQSAS